VAKGSGMLRGVEDVRRPAACGLPPCTAHFLAYPGFVATRCPCCAMEVPCHSGTAQVEHKQLLSSPAICTSAAPAC